MKPPAATESCQAQLNGALSPSGAGLAGVQGLPPKQQQAVRWAVWLCVGVLVGPVVLAWLWQFPLFAWVWQPYQASAKAWPPVLCVFKAITHLPCATCGLTRGLVMLVQGQWQAALHYNPLSVPLYLFCAVFGALGWLRPTAAWAVLRRLGSWQGALVLSAVLVGVWLAKLAGSPRWW